MLKFDPQAGNFTVALKMTGVGGNSLRFGSGERVCHHQCHQGVCSWALRENDAARDSIPHPSLDLPEARDGVLPWLAPLSWQKAAEFREMAGRLLLAMSR